MLWYLLNIFIMFIAWSWPVSTMSNQSILTSKIEQIRRKRVCLVGTLNWIILSGLRNISVGADTESYKIMFDVAKNKSWNNVIDEIYQKYILGAGDKDPGFLVFEKIIQFISNDFQIFLIIIAIIFFVPMGILIYKNSENVLISFILFSTLFYSFFAITGLRQTVATSIVVWGGIGLIKNKKLIPFIFLVILSSTIHASAICFLPFYWISKIKINRLTLILYWIVIALVFAFRYQFLSVLQILVGYENYQYYEGASAGMFMYLLIAVAIFVTLFYENIISVNTEFQSISINALMMSCVFCPLLLINPSFMRVVQYYSIFLIFLLPNSQYVFKPGQSRQVFNISICAIMILLLINNSPNYSFCFG